MPAVSLGPDQTGSLTNVVVNSASATISAPVGVPGKVIRVYRIVLVVGGTTNLTIKTSSGAALSGAMPFVANGSFVLDTPISGEPWWVSLLGDGLLLNNSAAVAIAGTAWLLQGP